MASSSQPIDYKEEEKLMQTRINAMKAVLMDKHGLDIPRECDGFIARCVRSKDGALDKAIKMIIAFHERIQDFQNWEPTLQPTLYQEFYNSFAISPLLQRDNEGRRVLCFRLYMWEVDKMKFDEVIFACWMLLQYLINQHLDVQREGFAVILDFSNFSLSHVWAMKHWRLISIVKWLQQGIIGRIKGIHMVFHSGIVRALYLSLQRFIKEKIRKRILFHDNLEGLHQHVDPKGLPQYLGGELEPLSDACIDKDFIKGLLLQDDYFRDFTVKGFPSK